MAASGEAFAACAAADASVEGVAEDVAARVEADVAESLSVDDAISLLEDVSTCDVEAVSTAFDGSVAAASGPAWLAGDDLSLMVPIVSRRLMLRPRTRSALHA